MGQIVPSQTFDKGLVKRQKYKYRFEPNHSKQNKIRPQAQQQQQNEQKITSVLPICHNNIDVELGFGLFSSF